MPRAHRVLLLAVFALISTSACTKSEQAANPNASAAPSPAARPRAAGSAARTDALPTAAEAELALSMGKMLFSQAKFEEAEEQLKVAAAAGNPQADALLLKTRAEKTAKQKLAAAYQKFDSGDLSGAEAELFGFPSESALKSKAEQLAARIAAERQKENETLAENVEKALENELGKETPEEEAPAPETAVQAEGEPTE